DETPIPIENTTEFVSTSQDNSVWGKSAKAKGQTKSHDVNTSPSTEIPEPMTGTDTFMLLNTKSKSHKVTLTNDQIIFQHNNKDIVLINLFATWCPPCIGELSYLNTLQKKYSNDLLLVGVLTYDYIDIPSLESFIAKHEINYFISNSPHNNAFGGRLATTLNLPQNFSIPLMVMYVDGKYFTHYEGAVPVEMIEYDIKQAQKQLKLKSNKN
ncbi:MAG: hypothetical protein DRG09_03370, partial [Epsilonproteobacteria bacterium]